MKTGDMSMNPIKKHPYSGIAVTSLLALSIFGIANAKAQCSDPGLKVAGTMYVDGSFNHNGNARPEVLLPRGVVKLDQTFHQTSLKAFGGGSDARSPLKPSDIPAGICIVATGTEWGREKGWAVHSPSLRVTDDDGEHVTQRGYSMNLYCTVGSDIRDMGDGGCNAKITVMYKPMPIVPERKQHSSR
jgi:hypothetical protein